MVDAYIRWTWAELREQVDRFALALIKRGIRKNDRVLVQMPNRVEYPFAFFALTRIGVIEVQGLIRHGERDSTIFAGLSSRWLGLRYPSPANTFNGL